MAEHGEQRPRVLIAVEPRSLHEALLAVLKQVDVDEIVLPSDRPEEADVAIVTGRPPTFVDSKVVIRLADGGDGQAVVEQRAGSYTAPVDGLADVLGLLDTHAPGRRDRRSPVQILLVDDEAPVRDLLCLQFDLNGWATLAAGSGEDALDALDGFDPDVIVTDNFLPGMSGVEMVRRARRAGVAAEVVMHSAHLADVTPADREALRIRPVPKGKIDELMDELRQITRGVLSLRPANVRR